MESERSLQLVFEREAATPGKFDWHAVTLFVNRSVPKADMVAKNVGDFRRWHDHDSYQKALGRLLRDLRAGA